MQTQIIQPEKRLYIPCQHIWVKDKFKCCEKWICSKCRKLWMGLEDPFPPRMPPKAIGGQRGILIPGGGGIMGGGGVPISAWSCPYVICESWEGGQAVTDFTAGANKADNLGWTGTAAANLTVSSAGAGETGNGLRIARASAAAGNVCAYQTVTSTNTVGFYFRFYVTAHGMVAQYDYETLIAMGGDVLGDDYGNSEFKVMFEREAGDVIHLKAVTQNHGDGQTSGTVSIGAWHTLDGHFTRTGEATVRLDNVAFTSTITTANLAVTTVSLGDTSSNTFNLDVTYDNFQFDDADAFPTGAFS